MIFEMNPTISASDTITYMEFSIIIIGQKNKEELLV